jgi:hypothetical protein
MLRAVRPRYSLRDHQKFIWLPWFAAAKFGQSFHSQTAEKLIPAISHVLFFSPISMIQNLSTVDHHRYFGLIHHLHFSFLPLTYTLR